MELGHFRVEKVLSCSLADELCSMCQSQFVVVVVVFTAVLIYWHMPTA